MAYRLRRAPLFGYDGSLCIGSAPPATYKKSAPIKEMGSRRGLSTVKHEDASLAFIDLKSYIVVQYPESLKNNVPVVEYIPSKWAFPMEGKYFCNYPKDLNEKEISHLVDTCSDISLLKTKTWKINILFTKPKLESAKRKYKKILDNIIESATEEELTHDEESPVRKQAPPKKRRVEHAASIPRPIAPDFPATDFAEGGENDPDGDLDTSLLLRKLVRGQASILRQFEKMSLNYTTLEENYSTLVRQNVDLKKEIRILQTSASMRVNVAASSSDLLDTIPNKPDCLPLCTFEELIQLQRKIDDKDKAEECRPMVNYMQSVMNSRLCWKDGLRSVLSEILTPALQVQVNWEGTTQKSKGRSMPKELPSILSLLKTMAKKHPKVEGKSESFVDSAAAIETKNWLRHAGDRLRRARAAGNDSIDSNNGIGVNGETCE